jgi:hypothetical protein
MKNRPPETLESIGRSLRSLRLVFGISIILMALLLMYCLPSVVENTSFRMHRVSALRGSSDTASSSDMDMGGDMSGMDMSDMATMPGMATSSAQSASTSTP